MKSEETKEPKSKFYRKLILFGCFSGGLLISIWTAKILRRNEQTYDKVDPLRSNDQASKYSLKMQWKDGEWLNDANDKERDLCYLFSECFNSEEYKINENLDGDQLPLCHKLVVPFLYRYFDSGFYYNEKNQLVGTVSIESVEQEEFWRMNMYNVCVKGEARGKGVATRMVTEFTDLVISKRINNSKPVYIGLDIDFGTPSVMEAFRLYSKLGFNSWWEACKDSIHSFKYPEMIRELKEIKVEDLTKRNEAEFLSAKEDKAPLCMIKRLE